QLVSNPEKLRRPPDRRSRVTFVAKPAAEVIQRDLERWPGVSLRSNIGGIAAEATNYGRPLIGSVAECASDAWLSNHFSRSVLPFGITPGRGSNRMHSECERLNAAVQYEGDSRATCDHHLGL